MCTRGIYCFFKYGGIGDTLCTVLGVVYVFQIRLTSLNTVCTSCVGHSFNDFFFGVFR